MVELTRPEGKALDFIGANAMTRGRSGRSPFAMADFKKLKVWQKAHSMAVSVHKASRKIRPGEHSHLKSQRLRAAFSAPANIVEGSGKQSQREFCRFLRTALNSASETEYHLIAAEDMDALKPEVVATLLNQAVEVRKMLYGLIEAIERNPN